MMDEKDEGSEAGESDDEGGERGDVGYESAFVGAPHAAQNKQAEDEVSQ